MCGVGVAMGLSALGSIAKQRAQRAQYRQQAANYANMANTMGLNARIQRANESITGMSGAQEQSMIRERGRDAISGIRTGASANGVSGVSIGNLEADSARNTAEDLNTSRWNTNLAMQSQEMQAQQYDQQQSVYSQLSDYYTKLGNKSTTDMLLDALPSALSTWFKYDALNSGVNTGDKGSAGNNTGTWDTATYVPVHGLDMYNGGYTGDDFSIGGSSAMRAFGDLGDTSYWSSGTSTSATSSILGEARSVPLGVTIPNYTYINDAGDTDYNIPSYLMWARTIY